MWIKHLPYLLNSNHLTCYVDQISAEFEIKLKLSIYQRVVHVFDFHCSAVMLNENSVDLVHCPTVVGVLSHSVLFGYRERLLVMTGRLSSANGTK